MLKRGLVLYRDNQDSSDTSDNDKSENSDSEGESMSESESGSQSDDEGGSEWGWGKTYLVAVHFACHFGLCIVILMTYVFVLQ